MPRARVLASLLLLGFLLAGCGGALESSEGEAPEEPVTSSSGVYRAIITLAGQPNGARRIEWLDPASGAWRAEEGEETSIFTGSTYTVIDRWGARIRSGSPEFLGSRPRLSVAIRPLRSYLAGEAASRGITVRRLSEEETELRFARGDHAVVARIEPVPELDDPQLFALPDVEVVVEERQLEPGAAATIPVRPYWFGQTVEVGRERSAAAAVQYHSIVTPKMLASGGWSVQDNVDAYMVFYEDPNATGRTSATSAAAPPAHEVQVVSQPIDSPAAQQDLAAFDGVQGDLPGPRWPRQVIRLANGEDATLFIDAKDAEARDGIGFALATSSTLVNVTGGIARRDIARLAAALVPVDG